MYLMQNGNIIGYEITFLGNERKCDMIYYRK